MASLQRCYVDVPFFVAAGIGGPVKQFLGGNATINAPVLAGAQTIPVTQTKGFLPGQAVYVLDGPNSEVAYATAAPATDDTHLAISSGLLAGHGVGVSVSGGTPRGALGQMLLNASALAEAICLQGNLIDRGLFALARTETIQMPTTRAYLDDQLGLRAWPRWFPVTAVSAATLVLGLGDTQQLDATQAFVDSTQRHVVFPIVLPLGSQSVPWLAGPPLQRGDYALLQLTYTAGFAAGAVPSDFALACAWIAQELLMHHENPTGAADIQQGDVRLTQRLRGSGGKESQSDSLFLAQARRLLEPWMALAV